MNSVLQQFLVGKEEHGTFRFCGEEFRQYEDFGVHVTAKDNTERVQPITYDARNGLTRKATADETHQLRSVTQSLAWIARQTRPDLSYRISKIQRTFENACVGDRECNRIVEYATSASTRGICFSPDFSLDDAVVATISDASFCQEQEQIDGVTQNFKSQQACIAALALGNALHAEKMLIHPLSWSSTRIRRVLSQCCDGKSLCTVQCC